MKKIIIIILILKLYSLTIYSEQYNQINFLSNKKDIFTSYIFPNSINKKVYIIEHSNNITTYYQFNLNKNICTQIFYLANYDKNEIINFDINNFSIINNSLYLKNQRNEYEEKKFKIIKSDIFNYKILLNNIETEDGYGDLIRELKIIKVYKGKEKYNNKVIDSIKFHVLRTKTIKFKNSIISEKKYMDIFYLKNIGFYKYIFYNENNKKENEGILVNIIKIKDFKELIAN